MSDPKHPKTSYEDYYKNNPESNFDNSDTTDELNQNLNKSSNQKQIKKAISTLFEAIKPTIQSQDMTDLDTILATLTQQINSDDTIKKIMDIVWQNESQTKIIVAWLGHAIKNIVRLSNIYLELWGNIDQMKEGIRTLIYDMAQISMSNLHHISAIVKDWPWVDYKIPLYQIPYHIKNFKIDPKTKKLTINKQEFESMKNTGKCPAVGITTKKSSTIESQQQIVDYMIDRVVEIKKSMYKSKEQIIPPLILNQKNKNISEQKTWLDTWRKIWKTIQCWSYIFHFYEKNIAVNQHTLENILATAIEKNKKKWEGQDCIVYEYDENWVLKFWKWWIYSKPLYNEKCLIYIYNTKKILRKFLGDECIPDMYLCIWSHKNNEIWIYTIQRKIIGNTITKMDNNQKIEIKDNVIALHKHIKNLISCIKYQEYVLWWESMINTYPIDLDLWSIKIDDKERQFANLVEIQDNIEQYNCVNIIFGYSKPWKLQTWLHVIDIGKGDRNDTIESIAQSIFKLSDQQCSTISQIVEKHIKIYGKENNISTNVLETTPKFWKWLRQKYGNQIVKQVEDATYKK
jgi:hypothetical protein